MSPEEQFIEAMAEMKKEFQEAKRELQDLKTYLIGDRMRNMAGVMDILEQHRKEIYGDEATRHVGLKENQRRDHRRINSLESDRTKVVALCSGASAVVVVVWSFVKGWFVK